MDEIDAALGTYHIMYLIPPTMLSRSFRIFHAYFVLCFRLQECLYCGTLCEGPD